MPSAIYTHLTGTGEGSSPLLVGPDYSVCLNIVFDGVPIPGAPEADPNIRDPGLWFHNIWRSGDPPDYLTVFDGSDGSTDIERAHLGCCGRIRAIAMSRGVELENTDITCAGTEPA